MSDPSPSIQVTPRAVKPVPRKPRGSRGKMIGGAIVVVLLLVGAGYGIVRLMNRTASLAAAADLPASGPRRTLEVKKADVERPPNSLPTPEAILSAKDFPELIAKRQPIESKLRGVASGQSFVCTSNDLKFWGVEVKVAGQGRNARIAAVRPKFSNYKVKGEAEWSSPAEGVVETIQPDQRGGTIAGFNLRVDDRGITGLQAIFMEGNPYKFDTITRYESPWYGNALATPVPTLGADGNFLIGLHGTSTDAGLASLGVVGVKTDEDPRYYTTTEDLDPVFDHVEAAVRAGKTTDTPLVGEAVGDGRISFRDMPPSGAVLVGFETLGTQSSVLSIRPLYRDRYNVFPGKEYGQEISEEVRGELQTDRRVAPYGYEVGRVAFRAHQGRSALSWSYQALVQSQRPPSSDESELDKRGGRAGFIGLRTDLKFIEIPAAAIVVGVYGNYPKDRSSGFSGDFALGLITVPAISK